MQPTHERLPETGLARAEIMRRLEALKFDDVRGHWSRAFRAPPDVQEVATAAYNMFLSDNGLFSLRTDHLRLVE
jgi:hypothetical protein